jgi:hypothetical protein
VIFRLESEGAHNINLVTPTHYTEALARILEKVKPRLTVPVVWNSGGYEIADSLRLLDGLVDVYLPDFKYFSSELSARYSSAPDYFEVAKSAVTEMYRQTGDVVFAREDGVELIKKGVVGMYDNCKVKLSNNLYNDGTDDYMLVRTKRAIAFAGGIDETEAYRPESFFADAVKGLNVYGGKIVRPKELYVIKAHK